MHSTAQHMISQHITTHGNTPPSMTPTRQACAGAAWHSTAQHKHLGTSCHSTCTFHAPPSHSHTHFGTLCVAFNNTYLSYFKHMHRQYSTAQHTQHNMVCTEQHTTHSTPHQLRPTTALKCTCPVHSLGTAPHIHIHLTPSTQSSHVHLGALCVALDDAGDPV